MTLAEAIREQIEADARKERPDAAELEAAVVLGLAAQHMTRTPANLESALDTLRTTKAPHAVVDPHEGTIGVLAPRDDLLGGPHMVLVGPTTHTLAAVLAAYPDATVRPAGA